MDEIFFEEERDSRFSGDTAFLKHSRLPDQVKSVSMLFRARWWSVSMPYSHLLPPVFPSPCTLPGSSRDLY